MFYCVVLNRGRHASFLVLASLGVSARLESQNRIDGVYCNFKGFASSASALLYLKQVHRFGKQKADHTGDLLCA